MYENQVSSSPEMKSCSSSKEGKGKRLWKKVRYQLVEYHSLPGYLKDNEYILRHYRSEWPLKQTFLSIFLFTMRPSMFGHFDVSDAQQEHAMGVEHLVPRLSALRFELCPGYTSESYFWKIYFVLLHPRLDKEDAEILSTSQVFPFSLSNKVVDLHYHTDCSHRSQITRHQQNLRTYLEKDLLIQKTAPSLLMKTLFMRLSFILSENEPEKASAFELSTSTTASASEIVKHPVESIEIPIIDKSVIEEEVLDQVKDQNLNSGPSNVLEVKDEDWDDGDCKTVFDDWLKEESSEIGDAGGTTIPNENEDDVSFSDLEEDDGDVPSSFRERITFLIKIQETG